MEGESQVGGLSGQSYSGLISECYATGSVTGKTEVGGLIGRAEIDSTTKSYATGKVTGKICVGGLIGVNESSSVTESYWDIEKSRQEVSDGGTGLTTSKMEDFIKETEELM